MIVRFDVEEEDIRGVELAESVQGEPLTKKAVQEYCLSFEEIVLQLVSRRARNKAENTIQIV